MCIHDNELLMITIQEVVKTIKVSRATRGKKKYVTVVIGMKTFGEYCVSVFSCECVCA